MAQAFSKRFYRSTKWIKARELCKARQHGLCADCQERGLVTPIDEVHHIKPLTPENIDNPAVTVNQDNLVGLCRDCHFARHKAMGTYGAQKDVLPARVWFDEQGRPQRMESING
ncbi:HNH endonuclease [Atopobium fossor]|uniref:HNH endonuclease n=1 Tax=Atopobium fossor TaxID=39487 RepID=UPI0006842BEF|nr:HNH endonuclease signature motif containing protein [Atopobium fossor]